MKTNYEKRRLEFSGETEEKRTDFEMCECDLCKRVDAIVTEENFFCNNVKMRC